MTRIVEFENQLNELCSEFGDIDIEEMKSILQSKINMVAQEREEVEKFIKNDEKNEVV